jgi:hypothetical protein
MRDGFSGEDVVVSLLDFSGKEVHVFCFAWRASYEQTLSNGKPARWI